MDNIQELYSDLEGIQKEMATEDQEWQLKERLASYKGDDRVISFKEYASEVKDYNKKGLATGLVKLDEMIEGFHRGDLIAITAPTGAGKTSFCQFLTSQFSKKSVKSLWFSYEVPIEKLIIKFGNDVPDGFTPKVLTDRSLTWIETRIVESIVKYKTSIIFIDHLHYLFDMTFTKNPSLVIGDIMRNLKILARKYNIVIFIIAHMTKIRDDEVIGLNSIRDSSFVGQESDYVIALWRATLEQNSKETGRKEIIYDGNKTVISVIKNRYTGALGNIITYYENNNYSTEFMSYGESDISSV